MSYVDIFSAPEVAPIALSVLQTGFIFFLIIAGLQMVGRRVWAMIYQAKPKAVFTAPEGAENAPAVKF